MVLATVLLVFAIAGAAEAPLVWGFREAPAGAWRATVIFADVLFLVNIALGPLKAYVDKHTLLLVRDVRRHGQEYSWIFHYVDRTTASSAATFRLFRLFVFYVFLGHLLSCCYWRIATSADDGRYGGAEWWTVSAEMEAAALGHRWLFATTKSLTLLLGEDTAPGTAVECGFVCATISLGVFGLSVVIGQVTLVASDLDAIGRKKTEQVDAVLLYLRYRGVPGDVSKEIVRFIEYMWNSGQAEHETAGLETLPDSLKLRLDLALKQQLIRKSLVVIPGEVIVHEGHEGHEMFFIGSGSVRVYKRREDGSDIELAQLHAGSFFGEMALLEAQLRMASIAALTFCDLFVLSASDYEDISQSNSSLRDALHAFARKRRDSNADKLQALGTAPAEGDGGDETRVLVDDADAEQDALRHQLVKRVPIFEGVPPSAVLSIVNALQALVVAPGELIVREGNDGGEMFLIAKGSVRIFKERSADHFDDDGLSAGVVEIARLNAGSFFGEKALLEEKARRNASVAAATDCHVYVLSKTDYDRIASLNSTMRRAGLEKKARALGSRAPHHVAPTVHLR
ncbi:cyclic nucleotide-gated ion channel [Aureococcus anophagefferens]|nr:cyclic nucleotide-gated ion channel [Aureococcus anophagefferens]